jgi:uncharacterized protein (TIGR03067 family)
MKTAATTLSLFLVLAVSGISDERRPSKANRSDEKSIQGRWRVLVFESDGYWLSATGPLGEYYRSLIVTFTEDKISIKSASHKTARTSFAVVWNESYKIDPTKEPKQIDVKPLLWSDGKAKESGKVWQGIYDLQGDKLVLCIDQSSPPSRPAEFLMARGRNRIMLLLEHEKR